MEKPMLTVSKNNGAFSTADKNTSAKRKGNKGRLELFVENNGDGSFCIVFGDYGNYGRLRWGANFGEQSEEDLDFMINQLIALKNGKIETTYVPFEPEETFDETTESVIESSDGLAVTT